MALADGEASGMGERVLARLLEARWIVAAAIVAILLLAAWPGGGWPLAVLLVVGLLLVAAFTPKANGRRGGERPAGSGETPLDGVAVADLAASVPDPLIVFDARGVLVHANPAAASVFSGLTPGISVQLKFRAPEMLALIEDVLSGKTLSTAIDYSERVPVERVFRIAASPVGAGSGLFALVFKDQSESLRIDRMRADFIANASHELRTPLASISGFIETLRGAARDDAAARESFLGIMQNQTARMARLIDDLLSLSRLEMKPYRRPGGRLDLRDTVGGVVDALAPLAAESGVTVEYAPPDRPVEVIGDHDELFQVFGNLLENAIKYGQQGGRVVVSFGGGSQAGRREASVSFQDFGPGIAEEHIPRVTERFYRVDVETSRAQKGTGLGLAIVKHILTRHDARLEIASMPGEGATFTAHFPAP
jgi:two-component system phosphate regulon sensor histidine kinase PhoR